MKERPAPEVPAQADIGSDTDLITVLYSQVTLDRLLDLVVTVSAGAATGADGASVSLVSANRHGGFQTSNASSPWVRQIDEAQYDHQEGPCLEAIRTGLLVISELPDHRWPAFSTAASESEIVAMWAHPLVVGGEAIGALNLYSGSGDGPSEDQLGAAAELARRAGYVLANARSFAAAEDTIRNLRHALETRTTIGQATGILMARQRLDTEQAFAVLRRASQRSHRRLADLAAEIVAAGPPAIDVRPEPS